jgi:hypothetical protein
MWQLAEIIKAIMFNLLFKYKDVMIPINLNYLAPVVLVITIVAVIVLTKNLKPAIVYGDGMRFDYTSPEIVDKLYSMMEMMDDLLIGADVSYWVEGGTMLGAIRSKGLIKWDDDLDIGIMKEDAPKIDKLSPRLNSLGYRLHKTWFGYKVYPVDGKAIDGYPWKYPALDIFVMVVDDQDVVRYESTRARVSFGKCWMTTEELYPIKRHPFGDFHVNVPSVSTPYLDRCYGNDWSDHAYQQYDHEKEQAIRGVKVVMTAEELEPARGSRAPTAVG